MSEKTEVNQRMNHTLESMARVLFRSWFTVDFDPVRTKAEGRQPAGNGPADGGGCSRIGSEESGLGAYPRWVDCWRGG